MATLEMLGGVIGFLVYAYLLHRQNKIMQETNDIMREQGGAARALANSQGWAKRHWPMLVMGVLTIATWGGIALFFLEAPDVQKWHSDSMETIYAKTFVNETIEIDGKKFDHCTFQNVKLLFHGTAPSALVGGTFVDTVYLGSDSIAIRTFMSLNKTFKQSMKIAGDWIEVDQNGNVIQQQYTVP